MQSAVTQVTTPAHNRQRGMALFISLVFLVLLTLIGLSAMTTDSLETQMANNDQDQNLAFQAAEIALHYGENDVATNLQPGSGFNAACTGGLCLPSTGNQPDWSLSGGVVTWGPGSGTVRFMTGTTVPAVAIQPEYIVELLPNLPSGGPGSGYGATSGTPYRITAMGWGAKQSTIAMLQTTYIKY